MMAITIWNPWASLIIAGLKPYEFRSWAAPRACRGKRIAIHAGARPIKKAEVADLIRRLGGPEAWTTALRPGALALLERVHQSPGILPLSHVLGTAVLGEPVRSSEIIGEFGGDPSTLAVELDSLNWAWPLTDIRPLEPPVPARGAQGFWSWSFSEGIAA